MTVLTTSTFWNTFLRTPNEASAKGTGTDSFVQYPCTAQSHSDVCLRCTWAGIKQAKFTLYLRDSSLGFCLDTPVLSTKVCSHTSFITAACHSLSAPALLFLLLNTNLCTELKTASWAPDRELSAVFYYLQLKPAMNKEIKINKLSCYYSLCVEWGKKIPNQVYLLKWTWLSILCVNQLSPSYVLLQDKTVLKVKLEGSNKSFQYFQFIWQSSVHGKTECSEGSSVQDIYTTKYHLAAVSYV